jgi:hypothetical protein
VGFFFFLCLSAFNAAASSARLVGGFFARQKTEQIAEMPQKQQVSVTIKHSTAITTDGGGP